MELRDIVLASARAIANNQSPVQHTTPVRVIKNGPQSPPPASTTEDEVERERNEEEEEEEEEVKVERSGGKGKGSSKVGGGEREGEEEDEVKKRERYPGFRPWPTLQECAAMSLSKSLLFTSTWLSVTAKKIKSDFYY